MFDSYSGYRLFFRLVVMLLLYLVVGLLIDKVLLVMFLGSIVLVLWHYRQISRLNYWLWQDRRLTPPNGSGSWEGVFNGIYRLQGKNRKRVTQLAYLLTRFRQGAEALPDAAVVLDSEHNIIWCNKLAQLLLGLVWPQDNYLRIDNLIRHPDFANYLKNSDFNAPFELIDTKTDSRVLEIRIMGYGSGQLLLIARDITRVRQLEGMRKEFVANVSHELKTPLTVLQGYLEMMQDMTAPDATNAKAIEQMQQQTNRMQAIVEQLLVLSRIEDAAVNLSAKVDMKVMIETIKDEANSLSMGNYKLHFDCDSALNVYGNEVFILSACSNLVSNAIRYTDQGGEITIGWQRVPSGAEFSVRDTGEGIAVQHLLRLTERFYRVDSARSRQNGGTGLGLAITKHALSHHQSELQVDSTPGQGSRFSFIIPNNLVDAPARKLN